MWVTSSSKGDNPGALPFADRCLSWLEITDLFGRLNIKNFAVIFYYATLSKGYVYLVN